MKKLDFTVVDSNSHELKMQLNINKDEKPYVLYNNKKYDGYKPGEIFESEYIKNPMPLPKNTYGFVVEDVVFLFESSFLGGNTFFVVNKGYAAKDYKGKNRSVNIVKTIVAIVAIAIIVLSILMFI